MGPPKTCIEWRSNMCRYVDKSFTNQPANCVLWILQDFRKFFILTFRSDNIEETVNAGDFL